MLLGAGHSVLGLVGEELELLFHDLEGGIGGHMQLVGDLHDGRAGVRLYNFVHFCNIFLCHL